MRLLFLSLLISATLLAQPETSAEKLSHPEISVSNAWVRATPPGARTAAVYLTLQNASKDDALLAAKTNSADEAQLHTHRHDDGMMRMEKVDRFELPSGESVELKQGGKHLMLIDIYEPMEPGESIELTLIFERSSALTLQVPVRDGRKS